jgi:hypothetical protein
MRSDPGQAEVRQSRASVKVLWRHRLVIALLASLIPLSATSLALCRGPLYLEVNADPEYAYLLNALLVAEGRAPRHTDHPGTTVQVIGAATLHGVHLFGRGSLRDDVLLHPERYLLAFRTTVITIATLLSFAGGAMAFRAAGRLAHAAAVQCSPFLVASAAMLIDRPIPEPILLALGTALSGCVWLVLHRGPEFPHGGAAVVMGIMCGAGFATKVLFAPLVIVPIAALSTWRLRAIFAASAAVAFMISVLPMVSQGGRTLKWLQSLVTHTSRHGQGGSGVVDMAVYPGQLRALIQHEPAYFAIMLAALLVAVSAFARRRTLGVPGRMMRTLAAVGATQLGLLLLVAKHPADYYLSTGGTLGGLAVCLIGWIAFAGSSRWARVSAAIVMVAVAAIASVNYVRTMGDFRSRWKEFVAVESPTLGFVRAQEGAAHPGMVLQGVRMSTPESALHFGNHFAGQLFTHELDRLYPGHLFWDWTGITAFGRPATETELTRAWSGGALRAIVSVWFDPQNIQPRGLTIATEKSLGRERLIRATRPESASPDSAPVPQNFAGFAAVSGLDAEEGPYPQFDLPFRVRWGLWPETVLHVQSRGGPMRMTMECRPSNVPGQILEVLVNGSAVHAHRFEGGRFENLSLEIQTQPGNNEIGVRYGNTERGGDRSLSVLFRKLTFLQVPPNTP